MNFNDKDISNDFELSDKIYLNNASVSIMPKTSIEAMRKFLIDYNHFGPDSKESESLVTEKIRNVRKLTSELINCQPDEIVLTQSTTDGINFVANGLKFKENSNIVIRGLHHEHHANLFPWLNLPSYVSIRSIPIDQDGFFEIQKLLEIIDKNSNLLVLSHALYNTGAILPLDKISSSINNEIPFFVDAAQTVGCYDVDVKKINCDFMSFNGSKWLCGPMGTGFFYCSRKSSNLITPMNIGGESAMIYNDSELSFKEMPDKFQTGFRNYVGIAGIESSLTFLKQFGFNKIREKIKNLSIMFREELSKIPNVTIYGPDDPELRTSIISFNLNQIEAEFAVEQLAKQDIILAVREIQDKKIIRASPHFFNSEKQMMQVIDALRKL